MAKWQSLWYFRVSIFPLTFQSNYWHHFLKKKKSEISTIIYCFCFACGVAEVQINPFFKNLRSRAEFPLATTFPLFPVDYESLIIIDKLNLKYWRDNVSSSSGFSSLIVLGRTWMHKQSLCYVILTTCICRHKITTLSHKQWISTLDCSKLLNYSFNFKIHI